MDDYGTVADDAALDVGAGDFSIGFWCKNISSGGSVLLAKITGGVGFYLEHNNDQFNFRTALGQEAYFPFVIESDIWKHVVITRDGTTLVAYVDTIEQTVDGLATAGSLDNSAPLYIAGDGSVGTSSGEIDGLFLIKSALTPAQVQTLYNNGSGLKLQLSDFAAADGWYSNCDALDTGKVVGYKVVSGVQTAHNITLSGGAALTDSWAQSIPVPDKNPVIKYHYYHDYVANTETRYLFAFTKAHIYRWNTVTGAWVTVWTCSGDCTHWSVDNFSGRIVATNNVDPVIVWDETINATIFVPLGAIYSTGTTTMAASDTVEGAGGMAWNTAVAAGDIFMVAGDTTLYTVESITDADTLVLTAAYTGTTGAGRKFRQCGTLHLQS